MVKFLRMEWTLSLFFIAYIGLLLLPRYRAYIALSMAIIFLLLGYVVLPDIFSQRINWNVFLIIAGTMLVVQPFIDSGMTGRLADLLMDQVHHSKSAILALALFSGVISAFVDNVATVLIVAPIALDVAKKLKRNPVPLIIAVSVFANIQGFATLVGDTTSVMLAGVADMSFFDFFWIQGRPGPFFIVQLGTLIALITLWFLLGKKNEELSFHHQTPVTDYAPSFFLILIILLLVIASFIDGLPALTNGFITMGVGLVSVFYRMAKKKSFHVFAKDFSAVDGETLLLLLGLFIMILGLENQGVITAMGSFFESLSGNNLFVLYTLVVFISVIVSAFVDNIPYVATLLPVMLTLSNQFEIEPFVLYFGLLAGATLGGNITPIGASANIAGIGILRKLGYEVKVKDFLRIGIPITITAVLSGYVLIWILFGM
jgi:Na+/H+ antiporter NhaD/arsenite permease-like protein